MILLDMDTPGERVDVTLEMMEIAKFDGITMLTSIPTPSPRVLSLRQPQEIYLPLEVRWVLLQSFKGGQEMPETAA